MTGSSYSAEFYRGWASGSSASANVVVPLVLDLIPAKSVCDVGCGVGTWLRAFMDNGVTNIQGFDGPWVSDKSLRIPPSQFKAVDLSRGLNEVQRFDLTCSLEVAEHLPAGSAQQFVDNLVSLAPVVLFSAAIPHQGGTQHINEQWQSYWSDLFRHRGYVAIDYLRPRIWTDKRVDWWYRQNLMIYASSAALTKNPRLRAVRETSQSVPLDIVHPDAYLERISVPEHFFGTVKKLPGLFVRAIRNRTA